MQILHNHLLFWGYVFGFGDFFFVWSKKINCYGPMVMSLYLKLLSSQESSEQLAMGEAFGVKPPEKKVMLTAFLFWMCLSSVSRLSGFIDVYFLQCIWVVFFLFFLEVFECFQWHMKELFFEKKFNQCYSANYPCVFLKV